MGPRVLPCGGGCTGAYGREHGQGGRQIGSAGLEQECRGGDAGGHSSIMNFAQRSEGSGKKPKVS